jgi:hypothetical protein
VGGEDVLAEVLAEEEREREELRQRATRLAEGDE